MHLFVCKREGLDQLVYIYIYIDEHRVNISTLVIVASVNAELVYNQGIKKKKKKIKL